MKKISSKLISFLLILMMLFTINVQAIEVSNYGSVNTIDSTNMDYIKRAYEKLSPEAKRVFEKELISDPELLEFHIKYVDKDFKLPKNTNFNEDDRYCGICSMDVANPLTILKNNLASIEGLPVAVVYSCELLGASMVVALADDILPIGEILTAASTVELAVTCAICWASISDKFDDIVNAFTTAFSETVESVIGAFSSIEAQTMRKYYADNYPVSYVANTTHIAVNAKSYICDTVAETYDFENDQEHKKYYIAKIYNGSVQICPIAVTKEIAKSVIILLNCR